jgi:hypothetical protein
VQSFATVAALVQALREFKRLYNEQWLVERHGFRTPSQARTECLARSEDFQAGRACRRVG